MFLEGTAILKRFLSILRERIFDSRVDRGTPNLAAAPDGPDTRPVLSRRAASIILYGGSVKLDNAKSLMAQPGIDGLLVGGASLDPVSFGVIVNLRTCQASRTSSVSYAKSRVTESG